MADPRSVVAETSHLPDAVTPHGASATTQRNGHDTSPSDVSDNYRPLPEGSWILPIHGTCPRCHHYHRAVQIKIKVTRDPDQASYIHCDNCEDPWAAFSARNSTQISLLSTATTEPDLIEREVRYKLIDIVKLATARAANGTLDNSSSPVPSYQPSIDAHAKDSLGDHSTIPFISSRCTENGVTVGPAQQHQRLKPTMPTSTAPFTSSKQRNNLTRLLSKVKTKITARIPMLHLGHTDHSPETPKPSTIPARQFDKSPVRTPPDAKADEAVTVQDATVELEPRDVTSHQDTPVLGSSDVTVTQPAKLAEVATFIASLDASVLDSMTDDERKRWMRKAYTDFKARNKRLKAPLGLSPIVETSIADEVLHSTGHLNRHSEEVRHAGGGFGVLEFVPRRFSFASTDMISDRASVSDDNTVVNTVITAPGNTAQPRLQQLRRGIDPQRPQSMPNAPPSPRRLHRRGRGSFDSRLYSRAGSTPSLRGQSASLRSQGSITLYGSNASLYQTLSDVTVRPSDSLDRFDLEYADLLPPPSIISRDHSESPPPPRSSPRESLESRR